MTAPGHNSGAVAGAELKAMIERLERIDDELDVMRADRKAFLQELKGKGYDVKAVRAVVRERRKSAAQRERDEELRMLVDLYLGVFG